MLTNSPATPTKSLKQIAKTAHRQNILHLNQSRGHIQRIFPTPTNRGPSFTCSFCRSCAAFCCARLWWVCFSQTFNRSLPPPFSFSLPASARDLSIAASLLRSPYEKSSSFSRITFDQCTHTVTKVKTLTQSAISVHTHSNGYTKRDFSAQTQ